ncbi:MAG: alpha/beta hydrolase [Clostridia bacterium]|nr:alpha/beta hydrolase [Clostridia bacterium]
MKVYTDIPYTKDAEEARRLDIYLPEGKSFPTLLFFHGGGFKNCDKGDKEFPMLAEYFTSRGIAFVSANYRMYPEAKFPDFIEDGAAATAYVMKHIGEYGGNGRVIVGGSSAGGHISMQLCYDKKYLGAHGISCMDVAAFIHDAGQPTTHFNVLAEDEIPRYRCIVGEKAPLYYVGMEKEYPPQQFFAAEKDIPARYEEIKLLIATMKALRYDMSRVRLEYMEGYTHTGYLGEKDSEGVSVFGKRVTAFLSDMGII